MTTFDSAAPLPARAVHESEVTLAQLMLPSDANPHGNVHGGTVMMLVDTAGGIAAARHARCRVATVMVDSMTFLHPVFVGDLLLLSARLTWTGRTSMEVEVTVSAETITTGELTHTSTAYLVYVALDDASQPYPVPPLLLEQPDERRRWEEAESRRAYRLARRPAG
ncbi:MAG TPA: acyl-CoA thioesterase [Thermomicrobiaceae bacterium]|nr:acyl-CoA thioesterase [Thermomicrobiaceae bacterium]